MRFPASRLLLVMSAASCTGGVNGVGHVVMRFPQGFQGRWFLLPVGTATRQERGSTIELNFDHHGVCRIDPDTFSKVNDWGTTTCLVGNEPVEVGTVNDIVAGKSICDLGGYELSTGRAAKIAPYFDSGFVGDLKSFEETVGKSQKYPSEELVDVIAAEKKAGRS